MARLRLRQHAAALSDADLARRLNAELRRGEVELDFAGVESVTPEFALALLDGLDLGASADRLGAETMSPAVAETFVGGSPAAPPPEPVPDEAPQELADRAFLEPLAVLDGTLTSYR